jgi:hypothetical protein
MPHLYRIKSATNRVSISRLSHALQHVISRHNILRTALYLGTSGTIIQERLDTIMIHNDINFCTFSVTNLAYHDDCENIHKIIHDKINDSDLFHLEHGLVIHCHIFRHTLADDDLLGKDDCVLFCMHHSAFDGASTSIFFRDLALTYETNRSLPMNDNTLQYIDYTVHEYVMDTTSSRQFWHSQLVGYNLQRALSLPADRHRSSIDQRSGLASIAQVSFNNDISTAFSHYASSHQVTPFQLALSIFYAFLFKLTHEENDLCIGSINANRYRPELEEMIGMFVATLPYRVQIDSEWSFDELVECVREKCLSMLEHTHYPLQHILADFEMNQSNVSFLETFFNFIVASLDVDSFCLNGVVLEQMSIEQSYEMAKFDFSMTFEYNATSDDNQLSCSLVCSQDVFDKATVALLSHRFEYFVSQIFRMGAQVSLVNVCLTTSIRKLCLVLPEEAAEMKARMFCRQKNIDRESM